MLTNTEHQYNLQSLALNYRRCEEKKHWVGMLLRVDQIVQWQVAQAWLSTPQSGQTLKWSCPGGTFLHYLPPEVVGKGGERKKRLDLCTIWLHREQVGSQSSLKVPLGMILALWQGSLVWLLLGGGVGGCVWTGRHISSVWLGGEIV